MKRNKVSLTITAASIIFTGAVSASQYLGLALGENNKDQVSETLKKSGATFETDYGYRGYTDLSMFKVNSYETFNKFGNVNSAWLNFDPDDKLYQIVVEWADAGSTFKVLKDALDTKYGQASGGGSGFKQNYNYKDNDVEIILGRNTFGFGSDQKTSIKYTYTPSLKSVSNMKAKIEDHIRKENAAKVASDL